jgi:hypothetical protein
MVVRADGMLAFGRRLSEAMTGHEKTFFSRQIETTDRQIDALPAPTAPPLAGPSCVQRLRALPRRAGGLRGWMMVGGS